jgi:hypothetical protein
VFQRGFRVAKRHEDFVDRFEALCHGLFGCSVKRYFANGAHHAEIHSTFLASWLQLIGGLMPHSKEVPECILRSPLLVQAGFLRGLFADGTVNLKGEVLDHISLDAKSGALIDVVRTMLLRQGIVSGCVRGRPTHRLCVYGEYAKRFGEYVGFVSGFKRERLSRTPGKQTKYFVPVSPQEAQQLRLEGRKALGSSTCNNVVLRGRISLHNLFRVPEFKGGIIDVLRERARYLHEPVVSLSHEEGPSVCVEVPNGHRFLQNGFCAWNSQGQEYDVIVLPLTKSFGHQLQRNLFYTAITRARKRVLLVGHSEAISMSVYNDRVDARNTLFPDRLLAAFAVAAGGSNMATTA